ncbi:MAG: PHP domain-containing protein [Nitrospirota bacterium]|nr:MAG: PHP domain-containing protein [Nitrospirota bacterium]
MARIDLHLHTTYSDGSFSPHEVVTMAHHAGVSTIAITDHDTTDGLPEAFTRASTFNLHIIPGIEISSQFRGKETHILGYFVTWQDPTFQRRLSFMRETRCTRIPKIINKLKQLGVVITEEEVKDVAGIGSIGRPHIAQVILAKGYVKSVKEAFERYLGHGAAAFVPRDLPDAAEVISWIQEVGGVAVLAHPGWVEEKQNGLSPFCEALKECGLQGLEVFYSTHTSKQISEYLFLAKRLDLLVTGGSDFHGQAKPGVEIGVGRGNLKISEKLLGPLEAARTSK